MGAVSTSSSGLIRVRLDLAYDGTHFHGWAAQVGLRTVEGEVGAALGVLARSEVRLTVAGRTDAGVHASHQVAHVDLPVALWEGLAQRGRSGAGVASAIDEGGAVDDEAAGEALVARLNGLLARSHGLCAQERRLTVVRGTCDVIVHSARVVNPDFDARFSALGRHYVYVIADRRAERHPVDRLSQWWVDRGTLDVEAMNLAAGYLVGEHDFLSFCKPREGATTIRTLRQLHFLRGGAPAGELVRAAVSADAFCHSMVRSLVGACVEVGLGRKPAQWVADLLEERSRQGAAPLAPAHGLTLSSVEYPPQHEWASRAVQARRRRDCDCP